MTRDEAKKKAEELIETLLPRKREYFLTPDTVTTASHCRAWEDGAKAGFMACYDMMVSGEPDGWKAVPVKLIKVEGK